MATPAEVEAVIASVNAGTWSTSDLVRLNHAVASRGKNSTSILGQYGEELVAEVFGGTIESFDKKAYDVVTPDRGELQVKTFTVGKKPGSIRSFAYDVVTLAVDPLTAAVVRARLYAADDLYDRFRTRHTGKHFWGGNQDDRFERGWTIAADVPFDDITDMFAPVPS